MTTLDGESDPRSCLLELGHSWALVLEHRSSPIRLLTSSATRPVLFSSLDGPEPKCYRFKQ